ncbi:AAA family ATPase [Streptomyces sp. NPDC058457]|uniref:AAA family ATPase n=1 Tax=Streptomyces sp. NPDC058457 TaxID=3346507 RepID=UPI003661F985
MDRRRAAGDSGSAAVLVGERRGRLRELHDLLDETRAHGSRVAVVTGPAGSGKSLLLRTFFEQAAVSGRRPLTATASRAEQAVPFALLEQLVRGVRSAAPPPLVARLVRLCEEGAAAVLHRHTEPGVSDGVCAQVVHRLCAALLDLFEQSEGPVVIGIDDTQHADSASLQVFFGLLRRMHTGRILLVLAGHTTSAPLDTLLKAELPSEPTARRLYLPPLTTVGVEELVARRLGEDTAHRTAAAYAAVSGGSPALVNALIHDNQSAPPAVGEPLVTGPAYREAVLTGLYHGGPDLLALARQLALLGETFDRSLLRHLMGLHGDSTQQAIGALRGAGLLTGDRFRHPQARLAVLGDMTPEERSDAYTRTARILHKNGAPVTSVAVQLLASERIGTSCSVTLLHEAAEAAVGDGQVRLAQDILHYADLHPADARQQAVTTAMLVRTEWLTDPAAAARWVPDLMVAAKGGQLASSHVSTLIGTLLWFGKIDAALDHLGHLRDPDWTRDPLTSAHRDARSKWLELLYPPAAATPDGEDRDTGFAPGAPLFDTDPQSQAAGLLGELLSCAPRPPSASVADSTLRRYPFGAGTASTLAAALGVLVLCGRLAAAARWAEKLAAAARDQDLLVWQAVFTALRAEIALRRGDPEAAERLGRDALNSLSADAWGVLIGLPLATAVQACVTLGRPAAAQELLNLPVPDVMSHTTAGLPYLRARGRYYLATGQPERALADFLTVGRQMRQWDLDLPVFLPWRTDAAEAFLRLGIVQQAAELAMEQLEMSGRQQPHPYALSLRLLAACRSDEQRPELLGEALAVLKEIEAPLELAQAQADLAGALLALGRPDEGRMLLYQARYTAERTGAQTPGRTGGPEHTGTAAVPAVRVGERHGDSAARELSVAEHRVARLAARGLSNRQIAGELFLTISTVEQHLTRVYRKLRVRGRTELARAMPRDPTRRIPA